MYGVANSKIQIATNMSNSLPSFHVSGESNFSLKKLSMVGSYDLKQYFY